MIKKSPIIHAGILVAIALLIYYFIFQGGQGGVLSGISAYGASYSDINES